MGGAGTLGGTGALGGPFGFGFERDGPRRPAFICFSAEAA